MWTRCIHLNHTCCTLKCHIVVYVTTYIKCHKNRSYMSHLHHMSHIFIFFLKKEVLYMSHKLLYMSPCYICHSCLSHMSHQCSVIINTLSLYICSCPLCPSMCIYLFIQQLKSRGSFTICKLHFFRYFVLYSKIKCDKSFKGLKLRN